MRNLIIMPCSATKKPVQGQVPVIDLYDGPLWKQVRNNWDAEHVMVLSAEHGLLEPGTEIETYDRVMDEDRLVELLNDGALDTFDAICEGYDFVLVVGGETYKHFALAAVATYPELVSKVLFAGGSYLQQRKALKVFMDQSNARGTSALDGLGLAA
jgi:hypothetical protein